MPPLVTKEEVTIAAYLRIRTRARHIRPSNPLCANLNTSKAGGDSIAVAAGGGNRKRGTNTRPCQVRPNKETGGQKE